ncbi:hypothetical protein LguiA_028011 [Lonicera macranthoides]
MDGKSGENAKIRTPAFQQTQAQEYCKNQELASPREGNYQVWKNIYIDKEVPLEDKCFLENCELDHNIIRSLLNSVENKNSPLMTEAPQTVSSISKRAESYHKHECTKKENLAAPISTVSLEAACKSNITDGFDSSRFTSDQKGSLENAVSQQPTNRENVSTLEDGIFESSRKPVKDANCARISLSSDSSSKNSVDSFAFPV